jgi:hypothetical protein
LPLQGPLEGIADILEQVPSVGHLHRGGGGLVGSLSIGVGPVARDDLDARPSAQPRGQRLRIAVREPVDDAATLPVEAATTLLLTRGAGSAGQTASSLIGASDRGRGLPRSSRPDHPGS